MSYLHQLVEFDLSDTGLILEESVLGSKQLFVRQILVGGLQRAENKCSHHQVQHDPRQQGQEGGAPHFLPGDPPAPPRVRGQSLEARIWSGSQSGYEAQLAINRKFL